MKLINKAIKPYSSLVIRYCVILFIFQHLTEVTFHEMDGSMEIGEGFMDRIKQLGKKKYGSMK